MFRMYRMAWWLFAAIVSSFVVLEPEARTCTVHRKYMVYYHGMFGVRRGAEYRPVVVNCTGACCKFGCCGDEVDRTKLIAGLFAVSLVILAAAALTAYVLKKHQERKRRKRRRLETGGTQPAHSLPAAPGNTALSAQNVLRPPPYTVCSHATPSITCPAACLQPPYLQPSGAYRQPSVLYRQPGGAYPQTLGVYPQWQAGGAGLTSPSPCTPALCLCGQCLYTQPVSICPQPGLLLSQAKYKPHVGSLQAQAGLQAQLQATPPPAQSPQAPRPETLAARAQLQGPQPQTEEPQPQVHWPQTQSQDVQRYLEDGHPGGLLQQQQQQQQQQQHPDLQQGCRLWCPGPAHAMPPPPPYPGPPAAAQ